MSERIQELAEHCDFYVGNEHHDKSHEEQQRLWAEKFAELIVGECLDKIGKNFVGAVGSHASAHNSAVLKCQNSIKEHFGIE